MAKKEGTKKKTIRDLNGPGSRVPNRYFVWIIVVFTFILYGNTITNDYSLDDYHIFSENEVLQKGFSAIPEIFSSKYAVEGGMNFGYRAIARASFAIEYGLFGKGTIISDIICGMAISAGIYSGNDCDVSPYVSHFFNVVIYILILLLLFRFLKRILKNFHPWLPFVITLVFAAHPVHTEVVASLKNRDELLNMLFAILALEQLVKYGSEERIKNLVLGIVFIIAAVLSKETFAAYYMMIPFTLYFFTPMRTKKVILLSLGILLLAVIATFGPFLFLSMFDRPLRLEENPLMHEDGFFIRIAYGAYILYYYLRLLIFPHPLLYYYGYDTIPLVGFGNPVVILSILFHLGIFAYAIYRIRKKGILAYAILIYLGSIIMYSNIVKPAPGIIAERWLFAPSIGFSIALGYGLFRLFRAKPEYAVIKKKKLRLVGLALLLILIPYTIKTIVRNKDWNTEFTLYRADMPFLYNSVKANDLYANEIMEWINKELSKPVNVTKFLEPQIQESIRHYERAVEILPEFYSAWNSLGIIQSRIYKNYDTALTYFKEALLLKPDHPQTWFNMGQAYEGMEKLDSAILYYEKNIELDPESINTRSRLANIYYRKGSFKRAIELNEEITRIEPEESLPYVNIGNYYFLQRDTAQAIKFYEKAVELGAPAVASQFLSNYYQNIGDLEKSLYYRRIVNELKKKDQFFVPGRD